MGDREIGLFLSQSVSPVADSFKPIQAIISPAKPSSIPSRLSACIKSKRPILSGFCLVEL